MKRQENPDSESSRTPILDSLQLHELELSFQKWLEDSAPRRDFYSSRRRIYLIFLIIRYSGAKLNEVLKLKPMHDIDTDRHCIVIRSNEGDSPSGSREVQIPEAVSKTLRDILSAPQVKDSLENLFEIDPAFVRRKFYERSKACGFGSAIGGPEMIRKARAVELLSNKMPLTAVQRLLGHSTPNLTSHYLTFTDEEIQKMTKFYVDREFSRKTSACNSFFGKIKAVRKGDVQALIELETIGGAVVQSIITHGSLEKLDLQVGKLVTAEIKAPWVVLTKQKNEPKSSAENKFNGIIERISEGKINTEYSIRLSDGTELRSITGTHCSLHRLLKEGDSVWALFNCYAVVLHVD
ncbi:MAG: TOBE domain-containing protein [Desulfobulbaceae bacterium]|jgi:molybdate transport system regulatory protein|nr:TOBE domain-containing protein [Desulfobulbaceae bacterium]